MSAREALIHDINDGMSVGAAAKQHGVTRSCAYKWFGRFQKLGDAGLLERSRAPEYSPNRTEQQYVDELLALKREHPSWGPAKLAEMLMQRHGRHILAVSTAGEHLSRNGMVNKRGSRQRMAGRIEHPPFDLGGAGHSMTTDFKGQFRMGNGRLCYPLTIADPFSRYVLAIDAMTSTGMLTAHTAFERVFREFGIPCQMLSDNGTPFCCSRSLGGLTQLSKWWIQLGIIPIRIQPGHPQQNGIHERMHRTLKEWIERLLQYDLMSQQESFVAFRKEFNEVRPHQSLGQKPPASAFQPYRPFPTLPSKIEYDTTMTVRAVRSNGQIKWDGEMIFASEVLAGENIGLLKVDEALWAIHYGAVRIGYLDELTNRIQNRAPQEEKSTKSSSREKTKDEHQN